jgi:hypothetical protein
MRETDASKCLLELGINVIVRPSGVRETRSPMMLRHVRKGTKPCSNNINSRAKKRGKYKTDWLSAGLENLILGRVTAIKFFRFPPFWVNYPPLNLFPFWWRSSPAGEEQGGSLAFIAHIPLRAFAAYVGF